MNNRFFNPGRNFTVINLIVPAFVFLSTLCLRGDVLLEKNSSYSRHIEACLETDADDNVYCGGSIIYKYDKAGNLLYTVEPTSSNNGGWEAHDIAASGAEYVYIAGRFTGQCTMGDISMNTGDVYTENYFIAKMSADGDWIWARTVGDANCPSRATSIDLDENNNLYVAGRYSNNTAFGPYVLTSIGHYDIFVSKLSPDGDWVWAKKVGSIDDDDEATDIAVEPDGSGIYIGGVLGSDAVFGVTVLHEHRPNYVFVAKMDALGHWMWAVQDRASYSSQSRLEALTIDANGIYITGYFQNILKFGSTTLLSPGSTHKDSYVAKLDSQGNWIWVKHAEAVTSGKHVEFGGIAIDDYDNLWVLGRFGGTLNIQSSSITAQSSMDGIIVKMDADGLVQMLRQTSPSDWVGWVCDVKVNTHGQAFFLQHFVGDLTIGTTTVHGGSANKDRYLLGSKQLDLLTRFHFTVHEPVWVPAAPSPALHISDDFSPKIGTYWQLEEELTAQAREIYDDDAHDTAYGLEGWDGSGDVNPVSSYGRSVTFDLHQDSTITWKYKEFEFYDVGNQIVKPSNATDDKPTVIPASYEEYFFWGIYEKKLYPLRPIDRHEHVMLEWNIQGGGVVRTYLEVTWPDESQIHIADTPTVPLYNEESQYFYLEISYKTSDAIDTNRKFHASLDGYAVLHYTYTDSGKPTGDLTAEPSFFEVVQTYQKEDLLTEQTWDIGSKITDEEHNDPGKTGWLWNFRAFYDGTGPNRAYQRENRTGQIIAVNEDNEDDPNDDILVIWYQKNDRGVSWPYKPVRYDCHWPDSPLKIVIASLMGSEYPSSQPEIDPEIYSSAHVYIQNNPDLPGFNPNEEHALLAPSNTAGDYFAMFALRNDLNNNHLSSKPYALLKYWDSNVEEWKILVYKVEITDDTYADFAYDGGSAATPVIPPYPLSMMQPCVETDGEGTPYWQDYKGVVWSKCAGQIMTRFFYPLQPGFDYDLDHNGVQDEDVGACVPWLDRREGGTPGTPIEVIYDIEWPDDIPELKVGETLLAPKRGLPDIMHQAAVKIVYDESDPDESDPDSGLAQIIEPLATRYVDLEEFSDDIPYENKGGLYVPTDVPYHIRARLVYNPDSEKLGFKGFFDDSVLGDPILLLNVMTQAERAYLKGLTTDQPFKDAVDALYFKTINPRELDLDGDDEPDHRHYMGLQDTNDDGEAEPLELVGLQGALTAGQAADEGYLTLAFNDDSSLNPLPVSLNIIRVVCGPYLGELKIIESDNVFDERLVLRHVSDFGGRPELFEFEWYYHPDEDGSTPLPLPDLDNSQNYGWMHLKTETGALDMTLEGANLLTLSDNWIIVHFKPISGYQTICQTDQDWSDWVGGPGTDAQLAEGWIKRVVDGLDPFESRVKDFHKGPTKTYASMVLQAGERYEGDIAFNGDPNNINNLGFIETYETVLRRGKKLSIDGTPPVNYDPANTALLNVASRIAGLYTMLGNEAYADASDPTIGFTTHSTEYGTVASSIFSFQNQLDSLLSEELVLLRGRDDAGGPIEAAPIYNNLVWNFTNGEGELAYATSYGIYDINEDGIIDEFDARVQYPQGHGDAWGNYLTAIKTYYGLLRHPEFDWNARVESINVGGAAFQVDYYDERNFAKIGAAKAKVGAEIVNLTFRQFYDEDPNGQYMGYNDENEERGWGVTEWGRRAGQGAYLDWLTANAIIPHEDTDYDNKIEQIDRSTISELSEIATSYNQIVQRVDEADAGLNPLGLAKGAVPFDIDPAEVDKGRTHFEQIWGRANEALENSVTVFNHANEFTQSLRKNQDTLEKYAQNVDDRERDYVNRLIELFGYPYADDIGAGRTYPDGFDGPDLYHYQYVDRTNLTGDPIDPSKTVTAYYNRLPATGFYVFFGEMDNPFDETDDSTIEVEFNVSLNGQGMVKPEEWTGKRRAQGELQRAISDIAQVKSRFDQAKIKYDNHLADIDDMMKLLLAQHRLHSEEIEVKNDYLDRVEQLDSYITAVKVTGASLSFVGGFLQSTTDNLIEALPTVVGVANDVMGPMRYSIRNSLGNVAAIISKTGSVVSGQSEGFERKKLQAKIQQSIDLEQARNDYETKQKILELTHLIREEATLRLELYTLEEVFFQSQAKYDTILARGIRLVDELIAFRKQTAADVQEYRYEDMVFRIFRNDALQKYRAQFDLAARYAYLAATAYDYETNLLGNVNGGGREFLTDIVKQRNLGQVESSGPVAGTPGLADTLARLKLNFDVLKGQLGFNNPQTETNRFSLRSGMLRISGADTSDGKWVTELEKCRVDDLWQVPEFKRFCQPFAPESAGAQPGLVIPFQTTVSFGLNFFAEELGGGDSAYDPTHFATRIRSVGVWFSNYNGSGLSMTPRIYLVPVGADVLRSPTGSDFETREWNVIDQVLPVPFPVGTTALNDPEWIPINDTLNNDLSKIRRSPSLRAYHDSGDFDPAETVTDTRLIGRSVWNTRWLLIIPGGTLLYDADEGLDEFIYGPDGAGEGIKDIKIFFQTYAYAGLGREGDKAKQTLVPEETGLKKETLIYSPALQAGSGLTNTQKGGH